MARLPAAEIRRAVRLGLEEDLGRGDATTAALFPKSVPARASIVAQQPLTVAGMAAAVQTFLMVDPTLAVTVLRHDGEPAKNGEPIMHVTGDGRSILQAERVALNVLQHLSGSQRSEEISPPSFRKAVCLVSTVDGIQQRTAENILAETGIDMTQFPSAKHLSSWPGMCPGNNESAGKRKSGKTPKGNRWLRGALGEAAVAAARTKDTYSAAQFRRIAGRRGKKRAVGAVGHAQLTTIYHMLSTNTAYNDLGPHHFDTLEPLRLTRHHVRRLQALGYTVTLTPVHEAA